MTMPSAIPNSRASDAAANLAAPASGDANRDAIVAFALHVEGPITTVVYDTLKRAIDDGVLVARLPDKTTLYRWLRGIHRSAQGRKGKAPLVVTAPNAAGHAERGAAVEAPVNAESLPDLQSRLKIAETRLNALGALLTKHHLFEHYRNGHKIMVKWLGRSRSGVWDSARVELLLEKVEATIVAYTAALREAGVEPPKPPLPLHDEAGPVERECLSVLPAPTQKLVVYNPASMPVYSVPGAEELPVDQRWGALAAQVPAASYGMVVGHVQPSKTEKDARMRARLLAPVLTGKMSVSECAAAWRAAFRGEAGVEGEMLIHGIDAEYRLEYRDVTDRTLRRWRDRVLEERKLAQETGVETALSVASILEHRQTVVRVPRKATRDLIDLVVKLFTEQKNWSKAKVARHLRDELNMDVSERLVQSILAQELSDEKRALARGGAAAADVMFRRRLFREAKYPNRTWIMDHSFLRHEITTPEHEGQANDFDFEFEFVTYRSGFRRRVKGLWLSLIMDACTRRVLAIRVWDKAPDTRDTLLVLRDAIERFGIPEILYTDNGADLNSQMVRQALDSAGIHHVNSLPYTPQGRGKIERLFRTIKEKVLEGIEGYYGGRHGAAWGDADLLTLEEVEGRIWVGIERLLNGQRHSETKRIPTDHYEQEVGARRLRHVGPAIASPESMLVLLLVHHDVLNRTSGFSFAGRRYYSVHLGEVPNGARLIVYYDPAHLEVVHVSVLGPRGEIVYLGPAEYYDKDHEPPTFIEQQRAEAEWAREQEQQRTQRQLEREQLARLQRQRAAGELLGTTTADTVAQEHGLLLASSKNKTIAAPAAIHELSSIIAASATDATDDEPEPSTAQVVPIAASVVPESEPDNAPIEHEDVSRQDALLQPPDTVAVKPRRGGKNVATVITMPWD